MIILISAYRFPAPTRTYSSPLPFSQRNSRCTLSYYVGGLSKYEMSKRESGVRFQRITRNDDDDNEIEVKEEKKG